MTTPLNARFLLVLAVLACTLGGASFAHAQLGASCDALHPCNTGFTCNNTSGKCEAVPSTPPAGTQTQSPSQSTGQNVTLVNPLGSGTDLPTLIKDLLQFVVQIGAVVVVFMLVYIGFLFVTAQGNEAKISQARAALMWTIIGALILLGAEAIAAGIQATVSSLSGG